MWEKTYQRDLLKETLFLAPTFEPLWASTLGWMCQKRPMNVSKEAYIYGKRPTKETYPQDQLTMVEIRPICVQKDIPKVTYLKRASTLPWAALQSALYHTMCEKKSMCAWKEVCVRVKGLCACEKRSMCVWKKVYVCVKKGLCVSEKRPVKETNKMTCQKRRISNKSLPCSRASGSAIPHNVWKKSMCVWKKTCQRDQRKRWI